MSKLESLKGFIKYIVENTEVIEEKLKEAYEASMRNSSLSGWTYGVEIDETSSWKYGPMSQNSQSMSSWNGDSYVLKDFQCFDPCDNVNLITECENYNDGNDKITLPEEWESLDYHEKQNFFESNNIWDKVKDGIIEYEVDELDTYTIIQEVLEELKKDIENY